MPQVLACLLYFYYFHSKQVSPFVINLHHLKNHKYRKQTRQGYLFHEKNVNEVLVLGLYLWLVLLSFQILVAHINPCLKEIRNLNMLFTVY